MQLAFPGLVSDFALLEVARLIRMWSSSSEGLEVLNVTHLTVCVGCRWVDRCLQGMSIMALYHGFIPVSVAPYINE